MKYCLSIKFLLSIFPLLLGLINFASATSYFVNDGASTGDIYCSAVGNDGNNGTSGSTPKATVGNVLATYDINAGDIIYIDKGTYAESITVTSADGDGTAGNPILFKGAGASNTIFSTTNSIFTLLADVDYVTIVDMTCTTSANNHVILTTTNTSNNIIVTYCNLNLTPATATSGAIQFQGSNHQVDHCTIVSSGFGIRIQNGNSNTITLNTITNTANTSDAVGLWFDNSSNNAVSQNLCNCSAGFPNGQYGIQFVSTSTNGNYWNNSFSNYQNGLFCNVGAATGNNFYFNSIYSTKTCCYGVYTGWTLQNNIFYTTSTSSTEYCFYITSNSAFDPTTLNYNLYYYPNGAIAANRNGTTYNTLNNWKNVFTSNGVATSNESAGISGNPQYTNGSNGDLSLSGTSPAIDVALNYGAVNNDLPGRVRPAGSGRDIGAYEYAAVFLPVELLSFTAAPFQKKVIIQWSTASEINNDYFIVERSEDGELFLPLDYTKGAGNSITRINYKSYDDKPLSGVAYYRLKQVDFDGSYIYSEIVAVSNKNPDEIRVDYDGNKINIYNPSDSHANIKIYDMAGRLIFSKVIKFESEIFSFNFNSEETYAADLYIFQMISNHKSFCKKIAVTH